MSEIVNEIMLKDGRVIELDQQQQDKLAYVILVTKDVNTQKIRVNGETFMLNDILDAEETMKRRQQSLNLGDERPKKDQQWG